MTETVTIEIPKNIASFLEDESEKSLNEHVVEILRERMVSGGPQNQNPRDDPRDEDPYIF